MRLTEFRFLSTFRISLASFLILHSALLASSRYIYRVLGNNGRWMGDALTVSSHPLPSFLPLRTRSNVSHEADRLTLQLCYPVDRVLGWIYTIAWSGSFYPQVILNYRRKSIVGYSLDFAATNPIGHIALLVVNVSFMYSSTVRREYQERHDGHFPQVQLNDVIFSAHASLLATLTFLQCFLYKVSYLLNALLSHQRDLTRSSFLCSETLS